MARYTGPKNKLSRREGFDLFNKGEKLRRARIAPGGSGKRTKKLSEYGRQLRAKQLVKRLYGVLEKQFRNYVRKAGKGREDRRQALAIMLETRLDNAVYRLGWAKTRPAARQYIVHGHVLVNNQKMSIPSYQARISDKISLKRRFSEEDRPIPAWLKKNKSEGKIVRQPELADIPEPISLTDVIEFYSRY